VIKAYPQIKTWALAGHSLGGTTAAIYVENNPGIIDILVFWAAYPSDTTDLSDNALQVISIFGSKDKLATVAEIEATKHLLPKNTTYIEIQGGNHEQFGDYGHQEGDGVPGITREEQHVLIVEYMLEAIKP
jgi:dienelactone hydrolase